MALDDAVLNFTHDPNADTARDLIRTATVYWSDAMIADDTFAIYLEQIANWLRHTDD